jgi:Putative prokaryotic signal transducing protein
VSAWQLLVTISDAPSAHALAAVLAAEGIEARIDSDAGVLGQAAPCRIYVAATQMRQARWTLSQRSFSDAELTYLATGEVAPTGEERQ